MRVAVIGSGVVGASVGWHLARRGVEVETLDAGSPGAGVTNWSFSWVNASSKTQSRPYFDLSVAGLAAYRELATTIGSGDWWHPTGHLRWSDDPTAGAALARRGRAPAVLGLRRRLLGRRAGPSAARARRPLRGR